MKKTSTVGTFLRDLFRKGEKEKQAAREKEIVKLAQQKAGKLSILEIVAETSMNSAEVEEMMNDMAGRGLVNMDVTETGGIIYVFPGMAERFILDNQELFRREISRDVPPPHPAPKEIPPPPRQSGTPPKREPRELPPAPPPKPKVFQRVEQQEMVFELIECVRNGRNATCRIRIQAARRSKQLGLRPGAKIYDDAAREYLAQVSPSSGDSHASTNARTGFVEYLWIPAATTHAVNIAVRFTLPTPQTRKIALLELYCKNDVLGPEFTAQFSDIPVE